MIRIGLDAMGGDFAPKSAVKGAVMALERLDDDCRVVLFGDKEQIRHILASEGCATDRFEIVHTSEVIEMGEHPAKAFQAKQQYEQEHPGAKVLVVDSLSAGPEIGGVAL